MSIVRGLMKRLLRSVCAAAVLMMSVAASDARSQPESSVLGVIVLAVQKGSEAEKRKVTGNDLISGWMQANHKGTISSPLDITWVEREWGARGSVILFGSRRGASVSWTLNASSWGIRSGANWPQVESIHLRMRELAAASLADRLAEYCREVCPTVADSPGARSWAFFEAATWLANSQRWKAADEFFRRSIEADSDSAYRPALIKEAWADVYKAHGELQTASRLYSEALTEDQKWHPDSLAVAFDLYSLALIRFSLSDLQGAETSAIRALHIRRRLCPNTLEVAKVLNYLGVFVQQDGDLDSAEDYLRQGLGLAERLRPFGRETAFAYNNLGAVEEKRGDLAIAEKNFLRDLEITSRNDPHAYLLSYSWSNLGTIAFKRGNLVRAKDYYQKALNIQETRSPKDAAMTMNNLALVLEENNELGSAETILRKASEVQAAAAPGGVEFGQTLDTLGAVLRRQGRFQEAAQTLGRALELRQQSGPDSLDVAESLHNLGQVYEDQRDFEKAQDRFTAAAQIRSTLAPTSSSYAETLAALGDVARAERRWDVAAVDYQKAIGVLDTQGARLGGSNESRFRFHARYASYYSRYVSLLMQEGKVDRAFEILEESRARTLLQLLSESNIRPKKGVPNDLWQKERRISWRLTALSDQRLRAIVAKHSEEEIGGIDHKLAELALESERVHAEIRANNPQYAALTQPPALRLADLKQFLDQETIVLEYSIGNEGSFGFALTQDSLRSFPLPDRSKIDSLAKRVYASLSVAPTHITELEAHSGDDSQTPSSSSEELSEMVLGPISTLAKKYRRIVVIADGALQYIPFSALSAPGNAVIAGKSFLAHEHEIVNLPSVTLLGMLRRQATRRYEKTISVFADPVFNPDDPRVQIAAKTRPVSKTPQRQEGLEEEDLARAIGDTNLPAGEQIELRRLWHSREEADAIRAVTRKGASFEALDFDATRDAVTSPIVLNSRIIHFATHGFLDSRNPALSGLVFSLVNERGEPRVGFFGVEDVFNSSFRADLVVLSACQTALGEEIDSEGVVGLTWGFLYSGAKHVVASLWNVDDASTAALMRLFYEGMENSKMSPTSALVWAQRKVAQEPRWANPYYWAGFTIQGDWISAIERIPKKKAPYH